MPHDPVPLGCPLCAKTWTVTRRQVRSVAFVIVLATECAAHMRDVHHDESMALHLERRALELGRRAQGRQQ